METVTSSMASSRGWIMLKKESPALFQLSCVLMPSIVTLTAAPGRPAMVEFRAVPVVFTPGRYTRKSIALRVARGRLATCLRVRVVVMFAVCDCTISAPDSTTTVSLVPPTWRVTRIVEGTPAMT